MQIVINGTLYALGQPLPSEITSCEITADLITLAFTKIPSSQIVLLKQWFNTLIDNCTCEWIIYNNTFYRVDELTKFDLD